jgi:hypothetical protein
MEYHQENFASDVPLDSILSPGCTYCPCKGFFILPSKTLCFIYNSHDFKKVNWDFEVRNFKLLARSFSFDKYRLGVTSHFSLPRQALEKIFGVI